MDSVVECNDLCVSCISVETASCLAYVEFVTYAQKQHPKPVSYTHLDVYKRQKLKRPRMENR